MSTVRRPSAHRAYIREVSKQTMVMRLQGRTFDDVIVCLLMFIRLLVLRYDHTRRGSYASSRGRAVLASSPNTLLHP